MAEEKEGQPGAQETDAELQQRLELQRRKLERARAMRQAAEYRRPDPPEPEVEVGPDEDKIDRIVTHECIWPVGFIIFAVIVAFAVGIVLSWVAFGLDGVLLTTPIYEKSFTFERLGPLNEEIWVLRGKLQDALIVQGEWQHRARQLVGQRPTEVEFSADASGAIKITGADNVTIRDSTFTVTERKPDSFLVEVK